MAKQIINVGTTANDKKGDSLRAAFQKVNANFTELYTALGLNADGTLNLGAFEFTGSVMSTTDSTPIVIDQAVSVTSDLTVGGDIVPNIANWGTLGSLAKPFRSLYVSNNTVYLGGVPLSLEEGTNELRVNNVPISQNITYTDIPNAPVDISDLTDNDGLLGGGGTGGGISISDFGLGFTDTLDAGKITTSKLYNENPNQGLNNQYTLEVTDGGVVALPDGSIINGATLKTIAGNWAGITAGPASPAGRDEDSWVWVDNDGATIATKYSTDNYQWKFDNTGNLILPNGQSIGSGSLDGIKMTTDRGTVLFGNSPECVPTLLTHFHIMKDDPANVDLFLGDDNNYVKLPGSGETAYGVEIGTNVGSAYTWRFETDGSIRFPDNTVQTTAYTGQTSSSGELYIMANVDGDIVTSTNGIDWTAPQASGMNGIQRVEIHNGVIVYIPGGEEGAVRGLYYSTEIGTVTLCAGTYISTETDNDLFWQEVHYFAGSDKWVAVGYNDGNTNKFPVLAHSDNGITWTVVFVDTQFVAGFNTDDYDWRLTDVVYLDETNQYVITSFLDGPGATGGIFITEDITVALDGTTHVAIDFNARSVVPWSVVGFGGPPGYVILIPSVGGSNDILSGYGTDPEDYSDSFGLWESTFIDELGYAPTLTEVAYKNGDFIGVTNDGQVATIDFGIGGPSLIISIPLPYTNTVFSISNANPAVITWGMGNGNEANNEKIVVTLAGEYNGTYYVDTGTRVLYTDLAMTTALDASGFAAFTSGTVTFSHGQYFDAAGASNSYYYIGNDDEQVFRSSNGITWTQLADFTGEYFNDFAYGSFGTTSGADGVSYEPDDTDNWDSPTVNTVQAALDELAARVTALQNFEIDGGNAYTPALGELLIDGNGA